MVEYIGATILIVLGGAVAGLMMVGHRLLGGRKPTPVKEEPFECGETPFHLPQGCLSIQFYLIAMLFIIFDIEILFLFPWAVLYRRLGFFGFAEMAVFLFILMVGNVYAWKKGALEWER